MTLYFAYGSNMSRAWMRQLCPTAQALGPAMLADHRFIVMSMGYASIVAHAGEAVHGVLWRIGPGDLDALDRYEDVAGGLYDRCMLAVWHGGAQRTALIYLGGSRAPGYARPDYCALVLAAAQEWGLPAPYVAGLARQLSPRGGTAGEVG